MRSGQLAFQHRNLVRNPVQKRHDKVDARPQHRTQPAKAFDHMLFSLRHDPDAKKNANNDKCGNRKINRVATQKLLKIHLNLHLIAYRLARTFKQAALANSLQRYSTARKNRHKRNARRLCANVAEILGGTMDQFQLIPIMGINDKALPRDRTLLDPDAQFELQGSIVMTGLRMPIEVFAYTDETGQFTHALISGLRRLTAYRTIAAAREGDEFDTIPAFVRTPASIPAAMAAMVAENEVRAETSPWEKGATLVAGVREEIFANLDAACEGLHPEAQRQKRARIRTFAHVVEELDGLIATPERLTGRQMTRLGAALRGGMTDLIVFTLQERTGAGLESQWAALTPLLAEAERNLDEVDKTYFAPGRPRRLLRLRQGLVIRRELSGNDWILRFSGPEARKGGMMDDVFDAIDRLFQKRG